MIRRCFYISPETDQRVTELAKKQQLTKSQLIEFLVTKACSETQNESDILAGKIVSALATSHLNLFKSVLQDTNRNSNYLLDMLNSFLSTLDDTTLPDEFRNVDQKPHSWYAQSKRLLSEKILNAQRAAYPLQRGDEE